MVWLALECWAGSAAAFDAIASSIDVAGVTVLDALKEFFPSPSSKLLGAQLIRAWGFDLNRMYLDRDERNNSSYQAKELVNLSTTATDDVNFIEQFWSAFEPATFEIEKHLLRLLLETQAREITGSTSLAGRAAEYARLDPRITAMVSYAFLERAATPNDLPLVAAAGNTALPAPVTAMIARAALLLRIACGLVQANFKAALVDPLVDLDFWWPAFGSERGFWPPGSPLDSPEELWDDVLSALDEARSALTANRFSWLSSLPLGLPRLCEAERIGLWALCH
jgi:hypothetical protein